MKTTIFAILTLSVSALFLSCSNDKPRGDGSAPYITPENYSSLKWELQKADFYCSNSSDCPSNVGLLFSNVDGSDYRPKIAQCTGFLIAEDLVATNSHCIPDRLKSSKTSCDSQISIRFIGSSEKDSIFDCKEILDYSPLGIFDPDYAFFKIEKTGREPLLIHKEGLKDNEPIRIAKVTPLSTAVGGRLEIENCKVGLGTLLNPKSTNSWSKTGVGLGCQATGGNSGSPVLNEEGHVIGILQSKMLSQYKKLVENNFKKFKLELPQNILPHMLFTSLSCVTDPVTGILNEQKCSYGESLAITDCIAFDIASAEANSQRVSDRWKKDLPSIFIYEFVTEENTLTTQAHPICVKPKSKYADYDRYVTLKGFVGFRKETLNLIYPHAISMGGRFNVDEEFRIESELQFVEEFRLPYSVDLVKEEGQWRGTKSSAGSSDWRAGLGFTKIKIPITLPECSDQQLNSDEISKIKISNGDVLTEQEYKRRQQPQGKKSCEK